ncbi:GH1 family beta-glucosidase [Spirochaeta africana]|uniref:Beta-glucosidase n=1 Tax=Spirochaeta africana (strain ATCC 700263 / DSM 8902 / Z-7692) TaxID=889378 RepID=H9UL14_SPIAZ|nr:GH1 family beta-glucosidase [Spirochaeta africana]AFG38207.1 beta-galactosidase [Spirochaeta africana DSM 8902]
MNELQFPHNFIWGTATASYQVEGATREDGRGLSIWDTFPRTPGNVWGGETGDVAADQYHRYEEDIALMKAAGLQAYRFSIAWPRILPDGTGEVNQAGIQYYRRLAQALHDAGIQPTATLYHWDLPQALEDAGGWPERATAEAFGKYAEICFRELGDLITNWITLNEPWCTAYLGYEYGQHAPGRTDPAAAARAIHHLNLGHGLAVQAFREGNYRGEIGITWNLMLPRPATRRPEDKKAAELAIARESRMFTDPVAGKGYPQEYLDLAGLSLPLQDGDLDIISQRIDFAGINYYTEGAVAWDDNAPLKVRMVPVHQPTTIMDWPIVPDGLHRMLHWLNAELPEVPLYITENGYARQEDIELQPDGSKRILDHDRIEYLRTHFAAAARAIHDGIPLKGYYIWSFIDNFEWAHGYSKRFGIVYCDYTTMERIPKNSYYFIREVIAGHERFQA